MYINKVLSSESSWVMLKDNQPAYNDICQAISKIDFAALTNPEITPLVFNVEGDETPRIHMLAFQRTWSQFMRDAGWSNRHHIQSNISNSMPVTIQFHKHRITSRMMSRDNKNFINWFLVDRIKISNSSLFDIPVLIVPMESTISLYRDNTKNFRLFNYEKCFQQILELSPATDTTPFLIIGISDKESSIDVNEYSSFRLNNEIKRVLEFPKEFYQAGIGILSYFSEIIKQKYPDIDVKVKIEQDGLKVRLIIETQDGCKDIIEKTLDQYALVITNKSPPESLLDDKLQIHALTNKLSLAELEVRQSRDLIKITETYSTKKIRSLEEDITFLRGHIGSQLHHMSNSQSLIIRQSEKEENLLIKGMDTSQIIIEKLIISSTLNSSLKDNLLKIESLLERQIHPTDEEETKDTLIAIKDSSPGVFQELLETIKGTAYGVSGNVVFQWMKDVSLLVS